MSFALVENNAIVTYPLNVRAYLHQIRTSAPPGRYKELGIYAVQNAAYPDYDRYTEKVVADPPIYDAAQDEVTQSWSVVAMTVDELAEFNLQWTLDSWKVKWVLRKNHWDRDFWDPVATYLQSLHAAGSTSDYADFATLLDQNTIPWTVFVDAWQIVQSNSVHAGVTGTVPSFEAVRTAWQEADTHVIAF